MTQPTGIRIAINVMRARLTIVGFIIAIVSFQISTLFNIDGGIALPGVNHGIHIRADMALFVALALSVISLTCFIGSSTMDELGACDHWLFVVGDLLMYLALASAITGFFMPLTEQFSFIAMQAPMQKSQLSMFRLAIVTLGSIAWFAAVYLGPIVSLLRSPFTKKTNISLRFGYLALLVGLFWFNHQVLLFEASYLPKPLPSQVNYWYELLQPLTW